jgi:hypothetical protein
MNKDSRGKLSAAPHAQYFPRETISGSLGLTAELVGLIRNFTPESDW